MTGGGRRERYGLLLGVIVIAFAIEGIATPSAWERRLRRPHGAQQSRSYAGGVRGAVRTDLSRDGRVVDRREPRPRQAPLTAPIASPAVSIATTFTQRVDHTIGRLRRRGSDRPSHH